MEREEAISLLKEGERGVQEWNDRRQREGIPDLSGANLSRARLQHANLRNVRMSGADLSQAQLTEADLTEADLSKANLGKANLSEALLVRANLCGAGLREAELIQADISEADITGARLRKANLNIANLSGANLTKADIAGAQLQHADCSHAILNEARLSAADLGGTNLSGAEIIGTDLSDATLDSADLSSANLSKASLVEASLNGADLSRACIAGADFREATMTGTELRHVKGAGLAKNLETVYMPGTPAKHFETCIRTISDERFSWEEIRKIGNLKLFAVSYSLLAFLMTAFYLGGLYNDKITIAKDWAELVVSDVQQDPEAHSMATALLARRVTKLELFLFSWDTVLLFAATMILVAASIIFALNCPEEVKDFSRPHWCQQPDKSLVHYWGFAWQKKKTRILCGVLYAIGGALFAPIITWKLCQALYYVWIYGNIFPLV